MPAEQRVTEPPSGAQDPRQSSGTTAAVRAAGGARPSKPARRPSGQGRSVRVTRAVVRHVDPWSVGKVSLCFYVAAYLVVLTALIILWGAASAVGVVDNVESFMDDIGFTNFQFLPGQLLRATILGGIVLAVAGAVFNVVLAVLYNLISEVVGGIRITLGDDDPRRASR